MQAQTPWIITTIAGNGTSDYYGPFGPGPAGFAGVGGPATASGLYMPQGVATDGAGNIYIADFGNARVCKINTAGIITTFAGTGSDIAVGSSTSAVGSATAIPVYEPEDVVTDAAGNVYIAINIAGDSRVCIVNTSGIMSVFAGSDAAVHIGDGGPATAAPLSAPNGIALDGTGNLYISDIGTCRIRKVNTSGIITTLREAEHTPWALWDIAVMEGQPLPRC